MQWRQLLDVLFPAQCAACEAAGSGLCERCFGPDREPLRFALPTLQVTALGIYEGSLKRAVLALKDGRRDAARALAERLASFLPAGCTVTGVPKTLARRWERGFDGCELLASLAAPGSALTGLAQIKGDAQRGRTRTQRLAATGRFTWRGESLEGREVVLLDDVVTTGSTLEDCAATLRGAGATVCRAVVVGHAVGDERIVTTERPRPALSRAHI